MKYSYNQRQFSVSIMYALLFVGYPLVAVISQFTGMSNRVLSICMRVFFASLCVVFLIRIFAGKNRLNDNLIYWSCLSFILIAYGLRFYFDVWIWQITSIDPYVMTGVLIASTLLPALAFSTSNLAMPNRQTLRRLYFILAFTGGSLFLFANLGSTGSSVVSGRVSLETFNPIGISFIGAKLAILSVFIFATKTRKSLAESAYTVGFALLGIALVLLGGSRGPMFAFSLALFILYISIRLPSRKLLISGYLVIGLFVSILLGQLLQDAFQISAFERFLNVFNFDSTASQSTEARIFLYRSSWQVFMDSPFFGSSIVEPITKYYPHNIFLELLMSTGILGGIVFLTIIVLTIRSSLIIHRYSYSMFWLVLLYVQECVLAMTSSAVWGAGSFWASTAAIIATASILKKSERMSRI